MKDIILSNIKTWEGKVKDWKVCQGCKREWTPRSLDHKGLCPDCRATIFVKYAPWVNEMKEVYDKIGDTTMFINAVVKKYKEGYFDNEDLYLKCGRCSRYVDEMWHGAYGTMCKECYLKEIKKEKEKESKKK
jgi:DNA-directed RNA polymerase subunit RPC12/RpoP